MTKELLTQENEDILSIESTISLDTIALKRMRWQVKMTVRTTLPRSYRLYKVTLELDDAPYVERIGELEAEFDASLFRNDKGQVKIHNGKVKEMKEQLERMIEECEVIDFTATVDEIKYKDSHTTLLMNVPDDVIESFNRQKTRLDIYKIILTPLL